MRSVTERAPAKINLHLRILGRREDGYHDLETLFQAIELHDTLEARIAPATSLRLEGDVDAGPAEQNLVLRAAAAFRERVADAPHVEFRLIKRIPAGAGLGGGSSDAAAALRALNALSGNPLGKGALMELGAGLGADVAFFLCGSSLAAATARGDVLSAMAPLRSAEVIVVAPGFSVATAEAFAWWDDEPHASEGARMPPEVRAFASLRGSARNDFERVVFDRHPELGAVRDALATLGADLAMLSGSGSSVYGLFEGKAPVESAAGLVRALLPHARLLRTRTLQ